MPPRRIRVKFFLTDDDGVFTGERHPGFPGDSKSPDKNLPGLLFKRVRGSYRRLKSDPSTPPDTPFARFTRWSCSSSPLSSQIPPHSPHSSILTCSACFSLRSAPQRGHLLWWTLRSAFLRSASSFTRIS